MKDVKFYIKYILAIGVILGTVAGVQYNVAKMGSVNNFIILPLIATVVFGTLLAKISRMARDQKEKNNILQQKEKEIETLSLELEKRFTKKPKRLIKICFSQRIFLMH